MRLLIWTRGVRGKSRLLTGDGTRCVVVLVILGTFLSSIADALPVPPEASVSEVERAVDFLTRFGYLPPSDPRTGNLRSESEFRSAVAAMQRFGALEATGHLDPHTVRLMAARRCGVPDYLASYQPDRRVRRYAIQGQKWPGTHLTWSVRSDDASDPRMVRAQLRRAFGVWSAASALTFSEVTDSLQALREQQHQHRRKSSADIVVSFLRGVHGDGYPFDGEGSVLAHAFFPGEGIGGDAHFDAEERWLPNQPPEEEDGVHLFAVAAHEIGHSLGLSHSSTPGSLMFPYYQLLGDGRGFRLPRDDAEGIRHLYGAKDPDVTPPTLPDLTSITTTAVALTTARFTPLPPETSSTAETTTTSDPREGKKQKQKKKQQQPHRPTPAADPDPEPPDICHSSIDAISVIRREIFVFKGNFFWRLHTNRTQRSGYPVSIDRFWYDLPPDISRIDALYERPADTKIVFFSGRRYWLFSANRVEPGYPKPLTELGLPSELQRVDAALVWGHNGKTYLFAGHRYWKLDEDEGRVELDYPRSLSAWRGVPQNLDAAFQWTDGNTYFFKDNKFWKFLDVKMRVEKKSPSEIGGFWFQCPSKTMGGAVTTSPSMDLPNNTFSSSPALHIMFQFYVWFLIHFLVYVLCLVG